MIALNCFAVRDALQVVPVQVTWWEGTCLQTIVIQIKLIAIIFQQIKWQIQRFAHGSLQRRTWLNKLPASIWQSKQSY